MADESMEMPSDCLDRAELEKLVEEHMQSGEYETAAFWAEKLVALEADKPLNKRLPELARYMRVSSFHTNFTQPNSSFRF
jgi:hypothetical protein